MRLLQLHAADDRGVVRAGGAFICPLQDATSAIVRREINGEYSLTVTTPVGAKNLPEIVVGRAIKATVNEAGKEQFFIIKSRQRSLTGGWTIYAEHQSYLYNGIILGANVANPGGVVGVTFSAIRTYCVPDITDISTWTYSRAGGATANFPARPKPITVMEALKSYLIGAAGGELIFDGFDVEYVDTMGADNGAFYRYAVNLTDMGTEDILDGYETGIYPFWGIRGDANRPLTVLNDRVYLYTGTWPMQVVVPVDMTDLFDTQPSQAQLIAACQEYEALHKPTGIPISISASRVRVGGDTPVDLGDTVRVVNTLWGIDQRTRIFALTFDALKGRVLEVQFGTINPGFAGAVKKM